VRRCQPRKLSDSATVTLYGDFHPSFFSFPPSLNTTTRSLTTSKAMITPISTSTPSTSAAPHPSLLDHCTHLTFDPTTSLDEILHHISAYASPQHYFPSDLPNEQKQQQQEEEEGQGKEQEHDHLQVSSSNGPPLLLIDVGDNQNVSDHLFFEILNPQSQSNPNMKFIGFILRNCHRLTHSGLVNLLSFSPVDILTSSSPLEYFQLLDLSGCSAVVTDDLLRLIGQNSSFHLKIVSLRDCFRLTDVGLHWLTVTTPPPLGLTWSPTSLSGSSSNSRGGGGGGVHRGGSCDSLTSLDLSGCGQITNRGVSSLAFHVSHLDELHLQGCTRVTSESIALLAQNCRALKILNLQGCVRIDDVAIDELTRHCFDLEVLNLQGCRRLTDASLFAIACNCSNLASLDIRHCSGLSHTAIATVLSLPHRFHSLYDEDCSSSASGQSGSFATEVTDPAFDELEEE
jgi:hypothetical protein